MDMDARPHFLGSQVRVLSKYLPRQSRCNTFVLRSCAMHQKLLGKLISNKIFLETFVHENNSFSTIGIDSALPFLTRLYFYVIKYIPSFFNDQFKKIFIKEMSSSFPPFRGFCLRYWLLFQSTAGSATLHNIRDEVNGRCLRH